MSAVTPVQDWHNELRDDRVEGYCDAILSSVCARIREVIPGAVTERFHFNAAEYERLLRVDCPDGTTLFVDVSVVRT